MKSAFRRPSQNGWTYVHLEGSLRIETMFPATDDARRALAVADAWHETVARTRIRWLDER